MKIQDKDRGALRMAPHVDQLVGWEVQVGCVLECANPGPAMGWVGGHSLGRGVGDARGST